MIGAFVKVWDEDQTVYVHQKSKTVWIAVGDYMGQRLEVMDSSMSAALKAWQEAARHRGMTTDHCDD
jgi:DNA-binding IclR family transcriptional regulator